MEKYQIEYNKLLERYENGIKYVSENKNELSKWLPEISKIMNNLSKLIKENNISQAESLNGFKEENNVN